MGSHTSGGSPALTAALAWFIGVNQSEALAQSPPSLPAVAVSGVIVASVDAPASWLAPASPLPIDPLLVDPTPLLEPALLPELMLPELLLPELLLDDPTCPPELLLLAALLLPELLLARLSGCVPASANEAELVPVGPESSEPNPNPLSAGAEHPTTIAATPSALNASEPRVVERQLVIMHPIAFQLWGVTVAVENRSSLWPRDGRGAGTTNLHL